MSDEEHDRIVTKMTRAMLMDIIFDSKNAVALALLVVHDITGEELQGKIGSLLTYLEETKEAEE